MEEGTKEVQVLFCRAATLSQNSSTMDQIITSGRMCEDKEMQMELIKAIQAVHVPCEEKLARTIDTMEKEHKSTVKRLKLEYDELLMKTEKLRMWKLVKEGKDGEGNYLSGPGIYIAKEGFMVYNTDDSGGCYCLEYEEPEKKYWVAPGMDCLDTHGFVELEDKVTYRVICRNEGVLNRFTKWANEVNLEPHEDMWGFIDNLPHCKKAKEIPQATPDQAQ